VPDVKIVEVGPRDGLQNESQSVSVDTRVHLIEALAAAGLPSVECGSFVSPKWVPQMADTEQVFARLSRLEGTEYCALVPNLQGLRNAIKAHVSQVAVFVSASESFSSANINCSIDQSLKRAQEVVEAANTASVPVRGYISCVLGCPYEGDVPLAAVTRVCARLREIGCYEISFGDTIGVGTPTKVRALLRALDGEIPLTQVAVHFHDTWGQALANILASLEAGVTVIDSSVAGLGGCPYAPGAAGNVATEDVVYLLTGMGMQTGVDLQSVARAGQMICSALGKETSSKAAKAMQARMRLAGKNAEI
jgi:hydroxymethylglutaryl-CoA lyase